MIFTLSLSFKISYCRWKALSYLLTESQGYLFQKVLLFETPDPYNDSLSAKHEGGKKGRNPTNMLPLFFSSRKFADDFVSLLEYSFSRLIYFSFTYQTPRPKYWNKAKQPIIILSLWLLIDTRLATILLWSLAI